MRFLLLILISLATLTGCSAQSKDVPPASKRDNNTTMDSLLSSAEKNLYSQDLDTSSLALAQLVRAKQEALPILGKALKSEGERVRQLAIEGLAMIADSSSASIFIKHLDDKNEKVRAWAAVGLKRINDSRAIDALVRTIQDYPNVLDDEHTLSSRTLVEVGIPALPAIIATLGDENYERRRRAFFVLRDIVIKSKVIDAQWEDLWRQNGSYTPDAATEERVNAVARWDQWLEEQNFE